MKKLLVLALVLAVAGLANAGLSLDTINGISYAVAGNTVTISSTVPVTGFAFSLMTDDGSDLSNAFIPAGFSGINGPGVKYDGGTWDGVSASVGTAANVTGEIFKISFTTAKKIYFVYSANEFFDASTLALASGTIYLSNADLTEGKAGSLYEMTVGQVPEPMTMLLLGLGGLFLRRK